MAQGANLSYIITHVFLPPKLPQKDDGHAEKDFALLQQCKSALESFQGHFLPHEHWRLAICIKMLGNMLDLRDPCGDMIRETVEISLGEMSFNDVLAFHVRGQNAGLIVRKSPEHFSFESFELSPTTKAVMATAGRLRRCFPGPSIALDHDRIGDLSFREALAQLLTELDVNTPLEAWPKVSKASSKTIEIRDTVHPKFITEMLIGILRGMGRPFDVVRIHKRTRDDVLWYKALKPWRRSPLWLLLRVALQSSLMEGVDDHTLYKSFMIFFMAHVLELALQGSQPSDILFVMAAKISRRVLKLATGDKPPWMQYVHGVVEATHEELSNRWHSEEGNPDPLGLQREWKAAQLSFNTDKQLSLVNLRPYLDSIPVRAAIPLGIDEFKPKCPPRINWSEPVFPAGGDYTCRVSLLDLECWVQGSLHEWLRLNLSSSTASTSLARLIKDYLAAAASTCAENAEESSLMLLTTMDLWMALDMCVTYQYPLLRQYEPGFPRSLFDPLLLPKRLQMERLNRVEHYIQQRMVMSKHKSSYVFRETNMAQSFAVKYFEQSLQHQQLRQEIEAAATLKRTQKKDELEQQKQEHRRLLQLASSLQCDSATRWDGYTDVPYHPSSCHKCQLKENAKYLQITVHEWPLPYVELEAKSAVFELDVPLAISVWRDITFTLLVDIFSPQNASSSLGSSHAYFLRNFNGLSRYVRCQIGRLQLASEAKPFVVAHYGTKKVSQATEENICVNNGLHYSMYDSKSNQLTTELLDRCDVKKICTFQLPSGPYEALQYSLDGTSHTSNEVLAWQADCPQGLNLHEYYAFATLRSGHRLQWRSIARELAARILDFSHEETYLLLAQAAWHAGSSDGVSVYRTSHIDLEEEEFGNSLLFALEDVLGTIEGNWQNSVALRSFVVLTTRLLSLSPYHAVHDGCYHFLRRAQHIALQWSRELGELLHEGQDADELKILNLRALEIALICCSTFDVDHLHLSALLGSNADVGVITECSIVIHDRCPAQTHHLPRFLKTLLRRFERLSQFLESDLRRQILRDQSGIDSTVQRVWAGYRPGSPWIAICEPNERWLTCETSAEGGFSSMIVHYNILDGSLLVNGSPLTRLPRSYELHDTYIRLFGDKVLDVVPSNMAGMIFETRSDLYGQQVHFRMYGSELIVRTRGQQVVCEVIPISAMHGDFPRALVQDYIHWLDLGTQQIEWRPLKNIWASSVENWQMRIYGHDTFILRHAAKQLIDVRSPTANAITALLSPLEHAPDIHIILNCGTGALEIHLPRMKLDFYLKDARSSLQSKQFRGMIVDERQSFGAFTGLVNKLVLRDIRGPSRCVIVPHGSVAFAPEGCHVQVTIKTTSDVCVKYHSYQVDSKLGRLIDNGSLQSRLFRLYLHATTSHCLVDRLTRRTGTEEALYGLAGAATRSFVALGPGDIEILEKIACLTPRREFYPKHLEVMQQIDWESLSPLSQHCAFHREVTSILDQAKKFQIFQEQPLQLPSLVTRGKNFLLERAAIRESSFRVHGFGAEVFTSDRDMTYNARDHSIDGIRELQTCRVAKLVDQWSQDLEVCPHLLFEVQSWARPVHGSGLADSLTVGFDLKWLDAPSKFLPDYWCTLHDMLSHSVVEQDKYRVMILLSTLAYSPYAKQSLVQTLLAFATVPSLAMLEAPRNTIFQLIDGYSPTRKKLISLIEAEARQFGNCPESSLPSLHGEKKRNTDRRRRETYDSAMESRTTMFVQNLLNQWPTARVETPCNTDFNTYIVVKNVMKSVRSWFISWHQNSQFQSYIQQTQTVLNSLSAQEHGLQRYSFSWPVDSYTSKRTHVDIIDLTSNHIPALPDTDRGVFVEWLARSSQGTADHSRLKELLDGISSQCSNGHEQQYASDLLKSFEALCEDQSSVELRRPLGLTSLLEAHLLRARRHVEVMYQMICDHLQTGPHDVTRKAQMLPRLSPTSILSRLASDKITTLPPDWKVCLVEYGLSIVVLQRAERLLAAADTTAELLSELENPGHRDWDPLQCPEWLLLEIENNIMIRQEQAQISREMMLPSSGSNSVMQLNMGLGKSSVIVPIVAASLADTTQLVRVIVLKPLAMQMFQLLAKRLGGMLNRRVCYMPISRSLNFDVHHVQQVRQMYEHCKENGSIILVQPEHILSFELMGLERLLSGGSEAGNIMVETQDWLYANSRDILDESDEILSVRFELIYTIGMQQAIEFSPERWSTIQRVLGILGGIAVDLRERFPHGLEVVSAHPGGFPRIRILQTLAGDELLESVVRKLCEDGLPGVNVWNLPDKVRADLFKFLTDPSLSATTTPSIREYVFSSDSMRSGLLLLKGLFASGVLRFAFEQKRWRVNYGHDFSRTMLAVPYHGKDSPAARAEFSHPDATIVLTCLSYYDNGLSNDQIRASFEALLQSDQAREEYERWVRDAPTLPLCFQHLTGINLSNTGQCSREVFPPLRFAKGLVDFYMSSVVFPAEMKEFPYKLSSSGWDIAREKAHPTTGFSGTNDSRYVLPLSISQCDLPAQLSTNAVVLDCLLRPENTFADVLESTSGMLDAETLLKMALNLDPPVRVILDVGAQILELSNDEFAHAWLSCVPESKAQAVIFFDSRNEICVLSRDGRKEPLQVSPFSEQMDQCLVYLDESHTRGTDLKLPVDYRAIVTLGPGLTKDRLVQACMRMRKLGKGQSVVFCSSLEIQLKIRECSDKIRGSVEVADVLKWCIAGTCASTRKSIPLWATQGVRHQHRRAVCSSQSAISPQLVELLLEPEAQSLQQRYEDGGMHHEELALRDGNSHISMTRGQQLTDIRAKCRRFEVVSFNTATLQEEQERELSPENEREQQVELPPALKPHVHSVHNDVWRLVTQGVLDQCSEAFQPAFGTLRQTTAKDHFESTAWPSDLLVTTDFARTVQAAKFQALDSFLRPVHWIVSCKSGSLIDCVILSPYEAQELLPSIRQHNLVTLHVYSPRLSMSVRTLEDLSFCAIPPVPRSWSPPPVARQLNLFAGQLYIQTYEEYISLCDFLGLCSQRPGDLLKVACDGFISPASRTGSNSAITRACTFSTSPVALVRKLVALRRKGQGIAHSHVGRIVNGELLSREQF